MCCGSSGSTSMSGSLLGNGSSQSRFVLKPVLWTVHSMFDTDPGRLPWLAPRLDALPSIDLMGCLALATLEGKTSAASIAAETTMSRRTLAVFMSPSLWGMVGPNWGRAPTPGGTPSARHCAFPTDDNAKRVAARRGGAP